MKTSFVGRKSSLRYAHFPGVQNVNRMQKQKSPCKSRVFRQSKNRICVKESSHVIAKCRNSTVHRR